MLPRLHLLPSGYQSGINSANSSLVVAGDQDKSGTFFGYVGDLLHGISAVFQYPGSSWTEAMGINSSGAVVGYYSDNVGAHAFWRDPNGLIVNVDPPGYSGFAMAYAVNDSGAFTGTLYSLGFITIPEAPPWCCIVLAP